MKEESAIKEKNHIMLEQEGRAENPLPRASSSIATQKNFKIIRSC